MPGIVAHPSRQLVTSASNIVIKIGSALLTTRGSHDGAFLKFANEVCSLRDEGRQVSLVSSGAISQGVSLMGLSGRPAGLATAQGLASVGQPALMNTWARAFAPTPVAQFLLSKYDLTNPVSFINARRALRALAERDVIPIGNENDTVATDEIKIGDNDTLGAAVAKIRGADLLVILTQVDGLYNGNPEEDSSAELIHTVLPEEIAHAESVAGDASSDGLGTGGFATKLQAVKLAYSAGIPVVIANGYTRNILNRVLSGEQIGTLFVPPEGTGGTQWLNNHWPVKGRLEVSEKAAERLCDRNTEHLWMEDVARVLGDFHRGDCVALGCNGKLLGRGLVGYDTEVIAQLKGLGSEKVLQSLGPKRYDFQVMDRADLVIYSEPH